MRLTTMAAIGLTTGCGVAEVHDGNGVEATEIRQVEAFDGVSAEMSIEVAVAEGEPKVEVTCDENLLEDIETVVDDGVLSVRGARQGPGWVSIRPEAACHVWVQTPTLREAISTGSGRLVVTGEAVSLAEIVSTGSGGAWVEAAVDAAVLEVVSTGSGGLEIVGGAADRIELLITGSGSVELEGVVAHEVEATLSGSGGGEVTATDALWATLTGSGGLVVHGDPQGREVTSTGSGDVGFEP